MRKRREVSKQIELLERQRKRAEKSSKLTDVAKLSAKIVRSRVELNKLDATLGVLSTSVKCDTSSSDLLPPDVPSPVAEPAVDNPSLPVQWASPRGIQCESTEESPVDVPFASAEPAKDVPPSPPPSPPVPRLTWPSGPQRESSEEHPSLPEPPRPEPRPEPPRPRLVSWTSVRSKAERSGRMRLATGALHADATTVQGILDDAQNEVPEHVKKMIQGYDLRVYWFELFVPAPGLKPRTGTLLPSSRSPVPGFGR